MNNHATVRTANEAAPALSPAGKGNLANCSTGSKTTEGKSNERRPTGCANGHRQDQRASTNPGRPEEPITQQFGRCLAPRQNRSDRHQEEQHEANRHAQPVEIRGAHNGPTVVKHLDEQREQRAEEHHEGKDGEQHIVREERSLAGER